MNDKDAPVLVATGIAKSYPGAGGGEVLADVNLSLSGGDSLAITGASGCGKSTLLHVLGGLIRPDRGQVLLSGNDLLAASASGQGRLRNRYLGFVYQFHHLLGEFSSLENVAMPLFIGGVAKAEALERAAVLLAQVGLADHSGKPPAALSGGQRQRVAIARALAASPVCILADEPTGNLDRKTASAVVDTLLEQCASNRCALLLATHDSEQAGRLAGIAQLRDGVLEGAD
ncbi:MAG: ABC transporter ATP-binding protein [Betaproteobacteria bacterium]|nr:ABC transporter ATP-binding protein [Betaproteobacteria bacterium]